MKTRGKKYATPTTSHPRKRRTRPASPAQAPPTALQSRKRRATPAPQTDLPAETQTQADALPAQMAQLVASLNATLNACGLAVNMTNTNAMNTSVPHSFPVNEGASTSGTQNIPITSSDPDYSPQTLSESESHSSGLSARPAKRKSIQSSEDSSSDSDSDSQSDSSRDNSRCKRHDQRKRRKRNKHSKHRRLSTSSSSGNSEISSSSGDEMPQSNFNTNRVRLDLRVPDKIKNKIWKNEYVDLGDLLLASRKPGALFAKKR